MEERTGTGALLLPGCILVTELDPLNYLAATIAVMEANGSVILGNPHWSEMDWKQVAALNLVQTVWGAEPYCLSGLSIPNGSNPPVVARQPSVTLPERSLLIATGGSSGQLRWAHHTWATLAAAVDGLQRSGLLPATPIHSFCILPLYHVSGFMQFVRSFLTGGDLVLMSFRSLGETLSTPQSEANLEKNSAISQAILSQAIFEADYSNFCLSLVPTQLYRLLNLPAETQTAAIDWLRQFQIIFVGGAALNTDLWERARTWQLPLAPTYGMTETGGMVATLSPTDFQLGNTSQGRSFPHVNLQILPIPSDFKEAVEGVNSPKLGRIHLSGKSVAFGYFPPVDHLNLQSQMIVTNDLGCLDSEGYLYVQGRLDRVIITGGEKVFPERIETIVLATGLVQDVAVMGVPDADWGEKVVALIVLKTNGNQAELIQSIQTIVNLQLTAPQRPKAWITVSEIPRNDRLKTNYFCQLNLRS